MLVEIILSIIAAILPILWVHLVDKLKKVTEDNALLQNIVVYSSKEMQELYKTVLDKVQQCAIDGEITAQERDEIIILAKSEAKNRGIKLFEILSPKVYEVILQNMIKTALSK